MGEAFIVRRGGTGGMSVNNAVIHVNAPLGSTVTFSKGGVVTKTINPGNAHTNIDGKTADYYYAINASAYGTWTMTASKTGETSVSETVTVSAAKEYDVNLQYIVPAEYQAIEYLQTPTNGCYFDTGIDITDNNIQTETVVGTVGNVTDYSMVMFGTAYGYAASANGYRTRWDFDYVNGSSSTYESVSGYSGVEGNEYHLLYNTLGGGIVLDDVSVAGARARHPVDSRYPRLWVARSYNSSNGNYYYGAWRYKKFIVKNTSTDTILRDLRPCYRKADHVLGFWDDVSKTFLLNQGTNPPIAGPDI